MEAIKTKSEETEIDLEDLEFRVALDKTIARFKINTNRLAEASGVAKDEISKYRNSKKDITTRKLIKILSGLSSEQRAYFHSSLIIEATTKDIEKHRN